MILFKKIVNVLLAVLLLVATTGITLNKHYCMGRLKSVAVFHEADNCMGKGFEDPMPCCKDVSEELKIDEITKATFDFKSSPDLYQIAIITWVLLEDNYSSIDNQIEYYNLDPPLPDQDIHVLHQVFLI